MQKRPLGLALVVLLGGGVHFRVGQYPAPPQRGVFHSVAAISAETVPGNYNLTPGLCQHLFCPAINPADEVLDSLANNRLPNRCNKPALLLGLMQKVPD